MSFSTSTTAARRGARAWPLWLARRLAALSTALLLLLPGRALADGAPWQSMVATSYCDYGYMADGNFTHSGVVAAGRNIPLGSLVEIYGYGVFVVEDRGGAIVPGRLDLWLPTCWSANQFGRRWVTVRVQRWGWCGLY